MSLSRERNLVEVKTGRISEAMQRYCTGRETTKRLANEAGAVIRFRGTTLYDFEKIDNYLSQLAGKG